MVIIPISRLVQQLDFADTSIVRRAAALIPVRNMVFFELFLSYFYDFLACSTPPTVILLVSLFKEKTKHMLLIPQRGRAQRTNYNGQPVVMDMVIFRTIFFQLLVFSTFTLLTLHFAY